MWHWILAPGSLNKFFCSWKIPTYTTRSILRHSSAWQRNERMYNKFDSQMPICSEGVRGRHFHSCKNQIHVTIFDHSITPSLHHRTWRNWEFSDDVIQIEIKIYRKKLLSCQISCSRHLMAWRSRYLDSWLENICQTTLWGKHNKQTCLYTLTCLSVSPRWVWL